MVKTLIAIVALGLVATSASAQTRVSLAQGDPLYWEADGPDAASVAGCSWHLYDNNVAVVPSIAWVTCAGAGAGVFTCQAPLPSLLAPGDHLVKVSRMCVGTAESDASSNVAITVALPKAGQPRNLRTTPQ